MSSDFLLTNVWQSSHDVKEKLLKLELLKPKLHVSSTLHSVEGPTKHWSKLDNLSYPPIYIHWNNGLVKKVYALPDSESMLNIKKGLASLFQLHVASEDSARELDVSGLCYVSYKKDKLIRKTKRLCQSTKSKEANDNQSELRSSTVTTSTELLYSLMPGNDIVQSVVGNEEVMMALNMWKEAAVFVKSKIKLGLMDHYAEQYVVEAPDLKSALLIIAKETGSELQETTLEGTFSPNTCPDCQPLSHLVKEYNKNLLTENLGTVKSAGGFLKLLDAFRRSSPKDLLALFKDTDAKLQYQLFDILAATQTKTALDVAFRLINFESKDLDLPERFLLCLSVSPHPSEMVLSKTLNLMKKKFKTEKMKVTVLITLASLVKTYCSNNPQNANSKVVEDIITVFLQGLQQCTEASCSLMYLYPLRNAAQPRFIPVLLDYVKKGGKPAYVALEALRDIGVKHFTQEVKEVLFKTYNQFWSTQESEIRVLAAALLIKSNPGQETIGKIILSLSDREQPEVSSLVLSKLKETALADAMFRRCIRDVLRNTTFGNYNNLAQNGTSTTYTKLMQETNDANLTYGINMEMRPTGMLKRTSLDLKIANQKENLLLISLSLFVQGFGLTDEEQKSKKKPEEHGAGMELSVLGVHLRPYTFFTGTGELMGLIWSGAGSEPNPALQANLLLMDQMNTVILQNGVAVDLTLKGALSTDVTGTVEISLWNKNSKAMVKNSAALLVQGFCRVDTSFVESHVDFALGGSAVMNMLVNLDYAEKPMKMCLQIEQPDFIFRHNVRKTETIPGSKHLIRTLKRRSIHFPGRSFALHQKNYNSCKKLLFPKSESFW